MIPQLRKYFVIVVHFGTPTPTDHLVETFLGSSPSYTLCIVVDHAKQPYISPIQSEKVKVIRPSTNSGYGGGINIGLGALLSLGAEAEDIVICLNNDGGYTAADFLEWQSWWQKTPESTLAGLTAGYVNLITGRAQETISVKLDASFFFIPYLHGAFLSAPFKVFMSLRGLPEQYFMYWEDVLFSERAHRRHIPLKLISKSSRPISPGSSQLSSPDHLYYLVRNGAVFLQHETPSFWRKYWTVMNNVRRFFHALRPDTAAVATVRRALHDSSRWPRSQIDYRTP